MIIICFDEFYSLFTEASLDLSANADISTPALDISKPCLDVTRPGLDITKPGLDITKPGLDITKPGLDISKPNFEESLLEQGLGNLQISLLVPLKSFKNLMFSTFLCID